MKSTVCLNCNEMRSTKSIQSLLRLDDIAAEVAKSASKSVASALLVLLAACGGNDHAMDSRAVTHSAPAPQPMAVAPPAFGATELMDWAERTYPQFFPSHEENRSAEPFVYRYYPQTQNYLGVDGQQVSVLGPISGGEVLHVGTLAQFECQAMPDRCTAVNELPRIEPSDGVVVVRDSTGRHLAWGSNTYLKSTEGTAIPGSQLRILATSARQVVVHTNGGMTLGADGSATAWGAGYASKGDLSSRAAFAAPRLMGWPGPVRQLSTYPLTDEIAVLTDGSVWILPGTVETTGQVVRVLPRRLSAPAQVIAISRNVYAFGRAHVLTQAGEVWRIGSKVDDVPVQVAGASGVRSISCGAICLAVRNDGSVVSWSVFSTRAAPVEGLSGISQVASSGDVYGGSNRVLLAAIGTNAQLWVWQTQGDYKGTPMAEPGFADATDVSCASKYCVLRRADGSLWGWGAPDHGELGQFSSMSKIGLIPDVTLP